MNLIETKKLALDLMSEHGLTYDGWIFKFDNARNRAGVCRYRTKVIGLSKYLVPHMHDHKVLDTILHEIAHALVGHRHGHDRVWQRQAIAIGCNGNRCYNPHTEMNNYESTLAVQSKYTYTCPTCDSKTAVHRRPKRSTACGKCCTHGYDPQHKMILTQNY